MQKSVVWPHGTPPTPTYYAYIAVHNSKDAIQVVGFNLISETENSGYLDLYLIQIDINLPYLP